MPLPYPAALLLLPGTLHPSATLPTCRALMTMPNQPASLPVLATAIIEITNLIARASDTATVLRLVSRHLALLLAHDGMSVWQWQGSQLQCLFQSGAGAHHPPVPDPISALVARTGQPVLHASTPVAAEAPAQLTAAAQPLALLSVPLRSDAEVLGAFTVCRTTEPSFQHADRVLLEVIAGLVLLTLRHRQLVQASQARTAMLSQVQEISVALNAELEPRRVVERIVAATTDLMGAAFSTVLLVDGTGQVQQYVTDDPHPTAALHQPETFRPQGTTATILQTRRPLLIEDVATDGRVSPLVRARGLGALVGLPLLVEDQVIGLLWVNFAQPRRLAPDERQVLETLAAQAATAIRNAQRYHAARWLADRDSLTSLANYRVLHERLEQELARARRQHQPLSVLMIDLNDFKQVNDTYGHQVGDEVLRRVARALQQACRASDIVGRYGGDEFLVILPDTPARGADLLGQRVMEAVADGQDMPGAPVTRLAIGRATWPEDGADTRTLLRQADHRLYQAKRRVE